MQPRWGSETRVGLGVGLRGRREDPQSQILPGPLLEFRSRRPRPSGYPLEEP